MELIAIIRMLCITLSLFLTPCCASHLNHQLQSPHHIGYDQRQLTLPTLPRKLKLNQVPTGKEDGAHKGLNMEMQEVLSGKPHYKEVQVNAARVGTRQEWIHGSDHSDLDPLQYFTMDYSHVRRRRPIHNKSLPIAP